MRAQAQQNYGVVFQCNLAPPLRANQVRPSEAGAACVVLLAPMLAQALALLLLDRQAAHALLLLLVLALLLLPLLVNLL